MSQTAILRMSEQAVQNIVKFVKVTINFENSNTEFRSIKLGQILTFLLILFSEMILEIPPCEDLEDWCEHEPKCTHEDVVTSCPKLCGTCEGI